MHFTISVRAPRSKPANWYSDSESGTGVTAPRIVAGSAPSATASGNGRAGVRERMIAEIERAATMRQPAHDHLIAADHLLAVDAEILPGFVGTARYGQAPGDQWRDILRPARLHGQAAQIDVGTFPYDFLAGRRGALLGRHIHHLHEDRSRVLPRILQALRRLGLLEKRE